LETLAAGFSAHWPGRRSCVSTSSRAVAVPSSSALLCYVSALLARCDLMLLQSSNAGAVPFRLRSCVSTSSRAVAVPSSSALLCYVSALLARCDLILLQSSNAGAVPFRLRSSAQAV